MVNIGDTVKLAACAAVSLSLMACDAASVSTSETRQTSLLNDFVTCDVVEVDLSGTKLLGRGPAKKNATDSVEVSIADGEYEIYLHYEDLAHEDPDTADQLFEIWYLEGRNLSGELALITNHTDDLPADQISSFTNVGTYLLEGIVNVSGRHASIDPDFDSIITEYNSIEPTLVQFVPADPDCLDATL
jgi:hypothetical protein